MDFRNIIKKMHELDPTKPSEDLQRLTEMAESTGISMGAEERPQPNNPNPKQTITESSEVIAEKAVSKAQQKLMGQAYALKKGDMKAKDASKEVKKLAKDMSKSDLKDFASTKHKKKPEHVADKKKTKKESIELVDDFGEIVEAKKSAAQKKAQEKFKAMVKGKKADDKDSMDESSHAEAKKKKEEKKKKIAKIMDEGSKPDFLDMDKDGDKKEPMKKAIKDAKKKKAVKESVEPKMSFIEMMKLVKESGGQQAIDPVDDALWNWANRVAQSKIEETAKQEIFAAMVYERNGGTFEMYDVLAEQKK